MKKLWRFSFAYFILGIACGVFYREYTKYTAFTGKTTLAFTHVHLLVLGTLVFLILMLFCKNTSLLENRKFKIFLPLYNTGLPLMVIMLFVRGMTQVQGMQLATGMDAAISGIAGIAHILITIALTFLFLSLKDVIE